MKILIVGNGGREHALLWKLKRDAPDADFYITRGNGGTGRLANPLPIDPSETNALGGWAEANGIDLTVVGPEAPLASGIADIFIRRGLPVFGPQREATMIEASKVYAKKLMERAGVSTARFATFSDLEKARDYIMEQGAPIVVKASGLAAGKGALICRTEEDALSAAEDMLSGGAFGAAGQEIVIEEFMEGEELSIFGLTDGERVLPMVPAQDYKRIGEGDTGPNTGGMGAYAPVSMVDDALLERIRREIFLPVLDTLRKDGRPFRGLLYAGLMLTSDGPRVVEFNARFGDPETQVLLPLLASSLLEPMLAIARGESLEGHALEWHDGAALATVLASRGYPESSEKGVAITIPEWIEEAEDLHVFHAGTARRDSRLLTNGGRVLAVTAVAADVPSAATRSREAAAAIGFEGRQFRTDIGWRELDRRARASAS